MKLRLALISLFFCLWLPASAQDDFEKWKKDQEKAFESFKDARDREFAKQLDEAWKFLNSSPAEKSYRKPKIEKPPAAPEQKPEAKKITTTGEIAPAVVKTGASLSGTEPVSAPPPGMPQQKMAAFGIEADFPYDPAWKALTLSKRDQASIALFFASLAKSRYEPAISAIQKYYREQLLNDWALGVAIESFAASIFPEADERQLLTWFLLVKSGFDARIGYNEERIVLMVPSPVQIFAAPYFTFSEKRYYVLQFTGKSANPGSIYTYDGNHAQAARAFDFSMLKLPQFPLADAVREVPFKWNDQSFSVKLSYNRNAVEFMKQYPQVDLPQYFSAQVSQEARTSLIRELKPLMEGRTEIESVNFLLRFVQTAFAYKTDEDQFGIEKYLFVDETLFYPYSDCEDRSILFAFLVRELLGNDVVGLKYPGHLATAVAFKSVPAGDSLQLGGRTFTVCDPTYINADAGMTMPDFKNESPVVVRF